MLHAIAFTSTTTPITLMSKTARRYFSAQRHQPPVTAVVREDDLQQHIEDTPLVSAVRNGKLVELPWNALTDEERRKANNVLFHIYE